jgi:hypothetical protein
MLRVSILQNITEGIIKITNHLMTSESLGNTTFRRLNLFPSPDEGGGETPTLFGLLLRLALSKGPHRVGVSPSHLKMETDSISEMLCFVVFIIPNAGQSPGTQWF